MHFACPGLLPMLGSGSTVIAPSYLLAQTASHEFSSKRLNEGVTSWNRPNVYHAGAWLKTCWQEARYAGKDIPALLSGPQEHMLWRRIIEEQTPSLFDIESTAALASRAANLIAEWHIPLENESWDDHEDGRQFRSWLAEFRKLCHEEGWISSADLWRLAPGWIRAKLCSSNRVVFAGFSNWTPALRQLREVLGPAASALSTEEFEPASNIPVREYKDFALEIEAAARWARAVIERDSRCSAGIFVPGLAKHRNLVERMFSQICYPSGRRGESVFHLHAAPPLREYPVIAGALLLLHAVLPRIPVAEGSAILRSPWIQGAAEERSERALAEYRLRRPRELDVNLRDLEYAAQHCPQFQDVLRGVRRVLKEKPATAEFSVWSEFFSDLLEAFGWPGPPPLNLEEEELVETWKSKLSVLASLSPVSRAATYQEALTHLQSILNEAYSVTGNFLSPIQVLDAQDAAGLRFDHAFVAGLSEENNFFTASTSPLIPLSLQRACDIPGVSARSAHENRQQVLSHLFSAAADACASYSWRILPAAQNYLSKGEHELIAWEGRTPLQSFRAADIEQREDTNAPPYRHTGGSLGGTGLIKDQSQCPFRAFAIRRLNARCPEDAAFGLDSRDRGSFVHEALRIIWEQLKTQEALRQIKPLELQFLIHDAVNSAVSVRDRGPLHQQLSFVETSRLAEVISAWLDIEYRRKKPFEVEITEQQRGLDIAGLHLDIRIDRIDRLENGRCLLIDYKSGDTSEKNLNGDRPNEPQLLAYAAAMREEVDGLFFAQLKPREPKLAGYAREIHVDGQKQPAQDLDWNEYMQDRIAVVERLAESFARGEAAVDPLPHACDFCDVKPLCRINEARRSRNGDRLDD